MVLKRSNHPEIMDDFSIRDHRLTDALKELSVINKYLGGNSVSKKGISGLLSRMPMNNEVSVLDVGSGGSDLFHTLSNCKQSFRLTGLDINYSACEYAQITYPSITTVNGSALNMPFKENSFDIVHASLFLHHFTKKELTEIIRSMYRTSRHGIVINDLRRSVLAYIGIFILTRLFSRSAMVRNDAPLSVRRGFVGKELKHLCSQIPASSYSLKKMWAFRWCVVIIKDHE